MIELPQALNDHVKGNATTLCHCWTLRRKDGAALGFTDHDAAIDMSGLSHEPESGLNASAVEAQLGLGISTMDVEGALRSDRIDADDLRRGLYDGATVETWLVNWTNVSQRILLRKSVIGTVTVTDGAFKAELKSLAEATSRRAGRLVTRRCDARLGDSRCGVNASLPAYSSSGTILAVIRSDMMAVSGLGTRASGWAEQGNVTWTSGQNEGLVCRVSLHLKQGSDIRIALSRPLPKPAAPGDTFTVVAGCNRTFETCKSKFANSLNFRGFPHLPGDEAVYTYVNGEGIYDGAPLVP